MSGLLCGPDKANETVICFLSDGRFDVGREKEVGKEEVSHMAVLLDLYGWYGIFSLSWRALWQSIP